MEDNQILKVIYTFVVGILLALFVGLGISTFYPGPKAPEYPSALNSYGEEMTEEQKRIQREHDQKFEQYLREEKPYSRNVSVITLVAGVALVSVSLLYGRRIKVIADGVLLGGLFTLLYSIGRGFASEDTKYTFVAVSIGLVIVIYLGYNRFVRSLDNSKAPKKKKS